MVLTRLCLVSLLIAAVAAVGWLSELEPAQTDQRYSLIEDGLYMGGYVKKPPPRTKAVLNLCELEDSYRCEHHLWESTKDAEPAPSIDWLRRMVTWIDERRRAGDTVYVHCRNGASRSGLVVIAYEMHKNGWTR